MQKKMLLQTQYLVYKKKCVDILNKAEKWNYERLPNNTLELQCNKLEEEINEVIAAEDYQHQIEELADVLICIGGMNRFDTDLAVDCFNWFTEQVDKYEFMDVIDYAYQKIDILYERDYSNGYRHMEIN